MEKSEYRLDIIQNMETVNQRPLRLLKGGLSETVSGSRKEFIDAYITDTRLMGVTCLRAHWRLPENDLRTHLYQFFYFDAEESGLENYESFLCESEEEAQDWLKETENRLAGGLGGRTNALTERETRWLVQSYVDFNLNHKRRLPENSTEFDFLLMPRMSISDVEYYVVMCKQCPIIDSAYQVINYFLMRCIGRDFAAAKLLIKNYVRTDLFSEFPAASLLRNVIDEDTDAQSGSNTDYYATDEDKDFGTFQTRKSYICQSLIEFSGKYFLLMTRVTLDHLKIVKYERISCFGVSIWEASLMLTAPEYVSLYEVALDGIEVSRHTTPRLGSAMVTEHESGRLFMMFYPHNDHVRQREYRMSDDVFGLCYVSDNNQIILASRSRQNIAALEREFAASAISPVLVLTSKYEFNHAVLSDFIHSGFDDFEEFVQAVSLHED